MKSVFAPAVKLLNHLTYPRKFGLLGLLSALPLGLVTFFLVGELNDRIAFSAKEQLGNEYLRPVQQFASDLREHRGLTWARADQENSPEELRRVDERLQRDVQDIDAVDRKLGEKLRTRSCGPRSRANAGLCKAVRRQYLPSTRPIGTPR